MRRDSKNYRMERIIRRWLEKPMMVEQDGYECIVTFPGEESGQIEGCDAVKLANSLWNEG
jgi:hypothetical protein